MKLNKKEQEVYDFFIESGASLNDMINVVIKSNGLVGVGLISLNNDITKYIKEKL
jgi:hypothetical protein